MKNKKIIYLFPIVIVFFIIFISGKNKSTTIPNPAPNVNIDNSKASKNMEELKIEDIKVGEGIEAINNKKVTVNYSGTLTNGIKFDSSYDRNEPFSFNLGTGEVIKGWDLGVKGMKVGGKRRLTIPSSLGYGTSGAGSLIPPNATLIFEVELLAVE